MAAYASTPPTHGTNMIEPALESKWHAAKLDHITEPAEFEAMRQARELELRKARTIRSTRWKKKNPDKVRQYSKTYHQRNKAMVNAASKKYHWANRERVRQRQERNRRATGMKPRVSPAVKWRKEELDLLQKLKKEGKTYKQIAEVLPGRTQNAVALKGRKMK